MSFLFSSLIVAVFVHGIHGYGEQCVMLYGGNGLCAPKALCPNGLPPLAGAISTCSNVDAVCCQDGTNNGAVGDPCVALGQPEGSCKTSTKCLADAIASGFSLNKVLATVTGRVGTCGIGLVCCSNDYQVQILTGPPQACDAPKVIGTCSTLGNCPNANQVGMPGGTCPIGQVCCGTVKGVE